MKKIISICCLLALVLTGCKDTRKSPYQYVDYTIFDTVTTILGYGESEEAFEAQAKDICRELERYHRLFDIYHDYPGINNLKTVNDQAGLAPVAVEQPILELLQNCREYYGLTDGRVNVAMGSVLHLWHEAREQAIEDPAGAEIPSEAARKQAAEHMDFQNVILDFENSTVFLKDPDLRLDVGAVAKGWAAQQVSGNAPEGFLISVGGNVCATGPKPDGSPWQVGIQNPEGQGYLQTVPLFQGSVVTSGDYQRFFEADGIRYHHIIDPDTLLPGEGFRSVTIVSEDSALADALSTALFLLPREAGQDLLQKTGAEALWMDSEGNLFRSPGFPQ